MTVAGPPAEAEAPGGCVGGTGAKQSFVVFVFRQPGVSHDFLVSTSVLHTLRYHVQTAAAR